MSLANSAITFSEQYQSAPDTGAQFHAFVGALFAQSCSGIASFEAKGKDGAIDCYHADGNAGMVWECKFIGALGLEPALMKPNCRS